jgi:hypothetical protein
LNGPYFHLLPEYRPHLYVSSPPEGNPKFLALSENLPQLDFEEFPYHPLETNIPTILNDPTNIHTVTLNQVTVETGQIVHLYISTDQEPFDYVPAGRETEMCGSAFMYAEQLSTIDQWNVGQEIRHVDFQESFIIPHVKPVWEYVESQ